MLLYHFPLTSSSATANLVNKGIKQDYLLRNNVVFETGGKLSSYALRTKANTDGLQIEIPTFTTDYTLCLRISISSNQYLCEINNEQIASSYVGITNSWCDVVIMKNKLYVDKVYKRDLTYSNGKLLIGGLFSNGGTCNCLIQDIRIYDYALSQAEINEYSRALVVHYPLQGNELNTSVLKDVSGFGNDAIQSNGSYVTDSPRALDSLSFNGISTYANRASIDKAITVSFWIKPKQLSTSQVIYADANSDICFTILSNSRGIKTKLRANTYPEDSITYNEWNHIVIVKGSTNNDLYVNGIKKTESSSYETLGHNNNVLYLGCRYYGSTKGLYYSGNISDFRIYATALSAEDIKNLYNSPIAVSKKHQTMAFEFKENTLYHFALNKNGIVQHNELRENDSEVNGCYNDKLITNKLIEQ